LGEKKTAVNQGCVNEGHRRTLKLYSEYQTTRTTILHPVKGLFSRTTWLSRYQKGKTSLDLNEARDGAGMAVASAGPYANKLHLAADR